MDFNSQPHKEADKFADSLALNLGNFNSQPHKEADVESGKHTVIHGIFQLTASQGG